MGRPSENATMAMHDMASFRGREGKSLWDGGSFGTVLGKDF